MKLKRVEHSVAFWAFSILLYGLCFSLIQVQAEALYRKTPRLTARTRLEAPKTSPMLDLAPKALDASRVHTTPPPAIDSNLVPVFWQPEKNSRPAPALSPQVKRAQPSQPAPSEPPTLLRQSHRPHQASVRQPVAVIPSASTALGIRMHSASGKPAESKTNLSSQPKTQSKTDLKLSTVSSGKTQVQEVLALQATAGSGTSPATRKLGEKPLVHFPQDLADTRFATRSTERSVTRPTERSAERSVTRPTDRPAERSVKSTTESGFYPVGYRPYLPASIVVVSGKHQEALSHYNRGSYYGHANNLTQAISEYQTAIRKNPNLADAYVGLSSAYLLKNQWEDVFLNASKALSLKAGFMDPANIVQAKYNLSTAYCAADDYGQAKFFFNAVKSASHPQTTELWEYLKKNCKPKP